jgi:hypothetical protein
MMTMTMRGKRKMGGTFEAEVMGDGRQSGGKMH